MEIVVEYLDDPNLYKSIASGLDLDGETRLYEYTTGSSDSKFSHAVASTETLPTKEIKAMLMDTDMSDQQGDSNPTQVGGMIFCAEGLQQGAISLPALARTICCRREQTPSL